MKYNWKEKVKSICLLFQQSIFEMLDIIFLKVIANLLFIPMINEELYSN